RRSGVAHRPGTPGRGGVFPAHTRGPRPLPADPSDRRARPGAHLPQRSRSMTTLTLDVRNATKRFGEGDAAVTAVRGVSLGVEPGGIVLIMGPSGSGKTTLLSMMGALLKPTAGSIHLDGTEISALPES